MDYNNKKLMSDNWKKFVAGESIELSGAAELDGQAVIIENWEKFLSNDKPKEVTDNTPIDEIDEIINDL